MFIDSYFHRETFMVYKMKGERNMDLDFFWLAIGIASAGYFIGEGLKGSKNRKSILEEVGEYDAHELIRQSDVHYFMGISKEDAAKLIEEHPDIPHILINNHVYYPKAKLREWLLSLNK